MHPYQHLFFDLDHTLWDFERSSAETLAELYEHFDLQQYGIPDLKAFLKAFTQINHQLWNAYDHHKATKETIRKERFPLIMAVLGVKHCPATVLDQLNATYLHDCPRKPHLLPHAYRVLEALRPNYELHIISNGFDQVQALKMQSANIEQFFTHVITSESSQHRKPQKGIFEFALQKAKANPQESVMIGDNLITDIGGANAFGIDIVFFNPEKVQHTATVTHEITCLSELEQIFQKQ